MRDREEDIVTERERERERVIERGSLGERDIKREKPKILSESL